MRLRMDRREFLKFLSLLPLLSLSAKEHCTAATTTESRRGAGAPNVLIVLFDTLSARHLPIYGYHRETTPNIARFAERATVYHRHYAAGNFTAPGTASLLTGTYPWTNRAFHHAGVVAARYAHRNIFRLFGDIYHRVAYPHNVWADLLVHQFREDVDVYLKPGEFSLVDDTYYGLFPGDSNIAFRGFEDFLFREMGFPGSLFISLVDQMRARAHERAGLEAYADLYPKGVPTLGTYNVSFLLEHVIDGVIALLSNLSQPFLVYLHFFPPHESYRPRREFVGVFDDGWTAVAKERHPLSGGLSDEFLNRRRVEYDEYVAYVDAEFGRLYDSISETGLLDSTYVVFTSDHGQLFERGAHGHDTSLLYEPVIHIPLLVSRPGQQRREDVYAATSCVDVLPTLLRLVGHPIPGWCEGKVLPELGGETVNGKRSIFSVEAKSNPVWSPLVKSTVALIKDRYKLIHYSGYPGYGNQYELYDLVNDPEELEDLYWLEKTIAGDMQNELEGKLKEVNRPYVS
jgi:arylsulfatase A-like enzyme